MTAEQEHLWNKVKAFELDDPESSFSFSDRLARENDWTTEYCLRAILEYKKFIFLICMSDAPLTPSDEIDQVWHLHLLYTQSYWIELCKETIEREIHHGPTKGVEERGRFTDQYNATLSFYETIFGSKAPEDIWPKSEIRFKYLNFSRVNRHKNWVVPKINMKKK